MDTLQLQPFERDDPDGCTCPKCGYRNAHHDPSSNDVTCMRCDGYEYEIVKRPDETWVQFTTRIAQEIRVLTCHITELDIDTRLMVAKITYHY